MEEVLIYLWFAEIFCYKWVTTLLPFKEMMRRKTDILLYLSMYLSFPEFLTFFYHLILFPFILKNKLLQAFLTRIWHQILSAFAFLKVYFTSLSTKSFSQYALHCQYLLIYSYFLLHTESEFCQKPCLVYCCIHFPWNCACHRVGDNLLVERKQEREVEGRKKINCNCYLWPLKMFGFEKCFLKQQLYSSSVWHKLVCPQQQ